MEQLELFPNDMMRFVEEMTPEQFLRVRERNELEFRRIAHIRHLISRRDHALNKIKRKFEIDISNIL